MKKIIFVIGGMTRGGAERVISVLANEYASKNFQVYIVLMLDNLVEYNLDSNIKIINLTGNTNRRIKNIPYWLVGLRRVFKNIEPDVIVSFVARINILVLLAGMGINKRIIISERNDPAMDGRSKGVDMCTKILYPKASAIIFQTERAKNYFGRRIIEKSIVIPNPIFVNINALEKRSKKIVSVGRLCSQKNHRLLIDAFKLLSEKFSDYELWIYGEGSLRAELEEEVNKKQLIGKVFLPGNYIDIHDRIKDAKLFVLSSDYEGLSNALLEAMSMGIACVSTNCAGSDEYIENDVTGKLVNIGDSKGLANAMMDLLTDSEKCSQIEKKGRERAMVCSAENILIKWHKIIDGDTRYA